MSPLYVAANSMLTPIGRGAKRVFCSVEAGINRYRESDVLGSDGEPIPMALVPRDAISDAIDYSLLSGELSARQKRLLRIATVALEDIKPSLPPTPIPLFLAGPERYTDDLAINHNLIKNLGLQSDASIDLSLSRAVNIGRAGVIDMIDMAARYFDATDAHYVLVGGVDSYYHTPTLDYLDDQHRLLLASNKDGFVPGEGAGFLLLISPNAPDEIKQQATATLSSPSLQQEQAHLLNTSSNSASLAEALTDVFEKQTDGIDAPIDTIYSSANGETYYTKELSVAMLRYHDCFTENKTIIHPAEYFGDIGAAFGAVMVGLAVEKIQQEKIQANQKENPILLYCASDSGTRAGLCVSTYPNIKQQHNKLTQQTQAKRA